MITGLTKQEKVTEISYNAANPRAEIYTHDTKLKKRLQAYAKNYPKLCKQIGDDKKGGLRFEIDKNRMSIRLTAPYSEERRTAAGERGKENYKYMNQAKEE